MKKLLLVLLGLVPIESRDSSPMRLCKFWVYIIDKPPPITSIELRPFKLEIADGSP